MLQNGLCLTRLEGKAQSILYIVSIPVFSHQ